MSEIMYNGYTEEEINEAHVMLQEMCGDLLRYPMSGDKYKDKKRIAKIKALSIALGAIGMLTTIVESGQIRCEDCMFFVQGDGDEGTTHYGKCEYMPNCACPDDGFCHLWINLD